MKSLHEFINEKLNINKDSKVKELNLFDYKTNQEAIKILKDQAKEHGLEIKFHQHPNGNTGDFTFFIYDKSKQSRYLVGYDGTWDAKEDSNTSFKGCFKDTLKYIQNYNK
jgi:hypothetical protein